MKPLHLYLCTALVIAAIILTSLPPRAPAEPPKKPLVEYLAIPMTDLPPDAQAEEAIQRSMAFAVPTPSTMQVRAIEYKPALAYAGRRTFAVTVNCENIYGAKVESRWVVILPQLSPFYAGEITQTSGADPWCGTKPVEK